MAVDVDALAVALRIDDLDTETTAVLTGWLEAAREEVSRRAPAAPVAVADGAILKLAGYWFDMPIASRGSGWANALTNSGAHLLLGPWIVRRAAAADPLEAL